MTDVANSAPAPDAPAPVQSQATVETPTVQTEDEALSAIYREAMADGEEKAAAVKPAESPVEQPAAPERDPATGQFLPKAGPMNADEPVEVELEAKLEEPKEPDPKTEPVHSEGNFRGWVKEKREAFSKLPKEAQDFVLAHQKELQSAHSRKESEFQATAKAAAPYLDVIGKSRQYLDRVARETNAHPHEVIAGLMTTENTLRYGSYEQKVATLRSMAKDYGIPVSVAEDDVSADPTQPGGESYSVIHDLKQENARLRAQSEAREHERQRVELDTAHLRIAEFRDKAGPDGQRLHPHFELVAPKMSQLLQGGHASTLEEAYRIASEPMRKAIEDAATARFRQERTESAQRAGRINVTTQPAAIQRFDTEEDALRHAYRNAMAS